MLGKLLKHEFKVTSRYFFPMFLALAAATLLLKLSLIFSEDSIFLSLEMMSLIHFIQGLFVLAYVLVVLGICFLSVFLLVRRFYVNMFGDEGYLTHTLPVTGGQLLNCKLICSLTWIFSLLPAGLLSFFILFAGTDFFAEAGFILNSFSEELFILQTSGFHVGLIIFELIIGAVITVVCSLLSYYLAITLGQHFMGNHRLAGSVLFYFVLSIISSAISSVFTAVLEFSLNSWYSVTVTPDMVQRLLLLVLGAAILISIIQGLVYYFLTRYLLTKKLNLY